MDEKFTEKIKAAAAKEPFAQLLELKPLEVRAGSARVEARVKDEHQNLFGVTHGGLIFSLLDEAFELASNSHGTFATALSVTINYLRAVKPGEKLIAEANEVAKTKRTGNYRFLVSNQNGELVAHGQGMVYRKDDLIQF